MQQFKVGDHVIVDEGGYLDDGLDGVVVRADGYLIVEGWSTQLRRVALRNFTSGALIKVDTLVTGRFAPGDHVIVTGNEGRRGHRLAPGLDAVIVDPIDHDREYWVEGVDVDGNVDEWFVSERDLVSADEPTHPERIYKTGDRVLITGNTNKCTHYLTVGTDAEVISDKGYDNWRPELYRVRGLGLGAYGAREQWVPTDDLEAEPTYLKYSPWRTMSIAPYVDAVKWYAAERAIDYTPTPAAWVLADHGSTDRAAALRDVVEMLGADTDGAKLVEVAEWLLSGKVPA